MKFLQFFTIGQITIITSYKKLANDLNHQFECFGENTEKYKTFSIPTEKEVIKVDK